MLRLSTSFKLQCRRCILFVYKIWGEVLAGLQKAWDHRATVVLRQGRQFSTKNKASKQLIASLPGPGLMAKKCAPLQNPKMERPQNWAPSHGFLMVIFSFWDLPCKSASSTSKFCLHQKPIFPAPHLANSIDSRKMKQLTAEGPWKPLKACILSATPLMLEDWMRKRRNQKSS